MEQVRDDQFKRSKRKNYCMQYQAGIVMESQLLGKIATLNS